MVLWNLLDGGLNCSGPLLGPCESMRVVPRLPILVISLIISAKSTLNKPMFKNNPSR
jgi:hypothetical protein